MKGDKRGSHVGVVISFVIFVTFLVFLYSIISPALRLGQNKEALSKHLELELIEKTSAELTTASVSLGSGSQTCVRLNNLISALGIGSNVIVKNDEGETIPSYVSSGNLDIDRGTSGTFFKIYYSPEFGELSSGSGCSEISYNLGITKTEEYVFESKVINLINYYPNYETLKNELKIPEGTEFGFGIVRDNSTETETNLEEISTNVYIKQIPINYVSENGDILSGYLKTKIW